MMPQSKHDISSEVKEFLETHSYENEPVDPRKYLTPETDFDPDDEEAGSEAPPLKI